MQVRSDLSPQRAAHNRGRSCCIGSALNDSEATYCIECGKPLLRCMAFSKCGGIVNESGHCPVCVHPQLQIAAGAQMKASVGGSVTVPFELVNGSLVDRKIFVRSLWSREGGEWRQERLGWAGLDPEERKTASVTACEIENPGLHKIEIMWVIASQYGAREEQFAYATSVLLDVPDSRDQPGSSIQINGSNNPGQLIQVKVADDAQGGAEKIVEAIDMKVERQEIEERRMGLRGVSGTEYIARSAKFEFSGFAKDHRPPGDQPIVTPDAMLVFGRDYRRSEGGNTDLRLLATDDDGAVDENLSRAISRRHFEVYLENERLVLHVAAKFGLKVNDEAHSMDDLVTLSTGDVITPIISQPGALKLKVAMRRQRNTINRVIFTRIPAAKEQSS